MRSVTTCAVLALSVAFAAPACAQPRASQHGGLSQQINTTTITLEYDRPVLRGRELLGELLDYEAVWTPGANRATWIEVSAPVTIQGAALPAGRYGIWTTPRENGLWEIVFVSEWDTHHSFFPVETEVARVESRSEAGAHMEVLTFYFPEVGPYEATLRFHWGETVVPLSIEVGHQKAAAA